MSDDRRPPTPSPPDGPDGPVEWVELATLLGLAHPSSHGTLHLGLTWAGGSPSRVASVEVSVGHLHRSAEKLFEARDVRQIMALADRHGWLSGGSQEVGLALAVEQLMALTPPPRATWLRTLLVELDRLIHHLSFLVPLAPAVAPAMREQLVDRHRSWTGTRMHPALCRVGGLASDLPPGWEPATAAAVQQVRRRMPELREEVLLPGGAIDACRGLGVIDTSTVRSFALTGPVARASGEDEDLRRDAPALAYGTLFGPGGPGRVVVGGQGDVAARTTCLLDEVEVSLDLVDACLEGLPGGPVSVRTPKTLRPPEGDVESVLESAGGVHGWYLVSRGDPTPWRLKARTPSFATAQALAALLPGTPRPALPTVLGSLLIVVGDVDR